VLYHSTLEQLRIRGDLIEAYTLLTNKTRTKPDKKFFTRNTAGRRGHSLKLYKEQSRLDVRKYFFSQRVLKTWNKLPEWAVNTNTVNSFKTNLYRHTMDEGGFL
jgi:ribonuclease P/MRP protein subunit RPP40